MLGSRVRASTPSLLGRPGVHSDPETGLDLLIVTRTGDFACGSAGCGVYVYVDAGDGYELAGWVTAQAVEGTMHFEGLLSLVFWQRGEEGPDSLPFVYQIETSGPSPELVYFGPLAG